MRERQCAPEKELEEVVGLLVFQGLRGVKLEHQADSVDALWRKVWTSSTVCVLYALCALCAMW